MSTRSSISVEISEGQSLCVYCHWDGYPSHNGRILLNHYNTQELAEALVRIGDISVLDASIEKPEGHTFDNRVKGYTTFYGRDRGEIDCVCKGQPTFERHNEMWQEWNYQFKDGKWYANPSNDDEWEELTEEYITQHD